MEKNFLLVYYKQHQLHFDLPKNQRMQLCFVYIFYTTDWYVHNLFLYLSI